MHVVNINTIIQGAWYSTLYVREMEKEIYPISENYKIHQGYTWILGDLIYPRVVDRCIITIFFRTMFLVKGLDFMISAKKAQGNGFVDYGQVNIVDIVK